MKAVLDKLESVFGARDTEFQRDDLVFLTVDKEQLIPALTYLKNEAGFRHLVLLSVVDWLEDGKFQITYHLNSHEMKKDIVLRVFIGRDGEDMFSIHELWPTAMVYERENREMFGINFPGCPRVEESFVLEGWEDKPPYRRDFDTKEYSEKTFFPRPGRSTNDPREYMKEKLYSEEEK